MPYLGCTGVQQVLDWLRDVRRPVRRFALPGICLLGFLPMQACRKADQPTPGVTLTLIDQSWIDKETQRRLNEQLVRFTIQTGIQVQVLPAPEAAVEQLATWRKLLESGTGVPDVYAIDVIWPGVLADNLLDLRSYVPAQEIAAYFPELIANYTVDGRLVALPSALSEGLLFYRVDLLREYGYRTPPETWQELEAMARRIQAGERAKGNKDFWGFVWQGAASEALTCNALEWQVSEGGGTIIENGAVTVNNPQTIRAWDRAARWVGSISPPGVIAYKEWDSFNIWQAGKAAFLRSWTNAYVAARAQRSPLRERFDIAALPRGAAGIAGTLGGNGYGVSRHSSHPREAVMLLRFLCSREEEIRRSRSSGEPPTIPQLYQDPQVLAGNPQYIRVLEVFQKGVALRPSRSAGKRYPDVSRAYFEAVHEVLSRKKTASQAAAELQAELVGMIKTSATDSNARLYQEAAASRP
jgi:trehalose/maltose transport system substrate-binding protein